jgi:POT family proton-dependent oligopeptide transporter
MLKDHPKGLLVAFFTNMGERFGFYTMMAILVMFLQARYGLDADAAGSYYSWFYFAIYALALVGGLVADWTKMYKTVILVGQIIMFAGYCLIAIPGSELWVSISALFVIALGNGLFKGNLQAVVGQMYDEEKYKKFRDGAFMIFYMGINIGAFFAPFVAKGIKDFWLKTNGYYENASLPALCHQYTNVFVGPYTNLFFNIWSILSVIGAIAGAALLFFNKKAMTKVIGAAMFLAGAALCYYFSSTSEASNKISPEVFQSFNPLFIVALTPLVMGIFAMLARKGKEPSSPKKIGIGMIIAAFGFVLVLIASLGLVSPFEMAGAAVDEASRVSPYWLMSSYLILTIAELFLSPIGLSFVAKVAPPRFQGLMQGGWLLATAIGNKFLFVGSLMWGVIDLYMLWGIFIICCILAAVFIFSIMKRLEIATGYRKS